MISPQRVYRLLGLISLHCKFRVSCTSSSFGFSRQGSPQRIFIPISSYLVQYPHFIPSRFRFPGSSILRIILSICPSSCPNHIIWSDYVDKETNHYTEYVDGAVTAWFIRRTVFFRQKIRPYVRRWLAITNTPYVQRCITTTHTQRITSPGLCRGQAADGCRLETALNPLVVSLHRIIRTQCLPDPPPRAGERPA